VVGLAALALAAAGCVATRSYVRTEAQKSDERTQQQLQVVDDRLGMVERGLAAESARRDRLDSEVQHVRIRVEETANQADQSRELAAQAQIAARDALQTVNRVPPPKTPEPVARAPETLVVHFRFADWLLDKSALLTLEKALRRLRENPTLVVKVEGHADNVGSPSQNLKLSERRAREVWHFLVANGVKRSRIEEQAVGEAKPVASNRSPTGRDQNRRVAITLLSPPQ
jgi:outer membrane protein OmpA-like peptidoglycan-associated protein